MTSLMIWSNDKKHIFWI